MSPAPKKTSSKAAVRARSDSSDDIIMPYPEKVPNIESNFRGRRTERQDSLTLLSRTSEGLRTVTSTTFGNRYSSMYMAIDTDDEVERDRRERLASHHNALLEVPEVNLNKEAPPLG